MAEVLTKIARYFATQHAQARGSAADAGRWVGPVLYDGEERRPLAPSLVRRRLTMTVDDGGDMLEEEQKVEEKDENPEDGGRSMATRSESGSENSKRLQRQSSGNKKKKKKKKHMKKESKEERVQAEKARRAGEGLVKAQERARRIQMEKMALEKQQQAERDASLARMQEEMRKIEEIRRKGKQFALRLRPQSAPPTPQSRTPTPSMSSSLAKPTEEKAERKDAEELSFRDQIEREVREKIALQATINGRIFKKRTQEAEAKEHLEAQLRKFTDRNEARQQRVDTLAKLKQDLESQISEIQNEAMQCRQERHRLEEQQRKERLHKQREAEKEIMRQLREEETRRLMSEERKQREEAAEARQKARQRVQSRAALLKRVLHGFDIRASVEKSRNQDEERRPTGTLRITKLEAEPELAEFEEDGLSVSHEAALAHKWRWQLPSLTLEDIHQVLLEELVISSDEG